MFGFPNPVNEVAARVVAGGVAVMAVVAMATGERWLVLVLLYGFAARVAAGPRFSPLGLLATRVIVPRLRAAERPVPGPPKRFAQGMGLAFSLIAAVLIFVFNVPDAAWVFIGMLAVAAWLEAAFGLCLGCRIFAALMRAGVIPEHVCEECADIWGPRSATD